MKIFACLLFSIIAASALQVNLKWDPNPETDIASYRVDYGTVSGTRPRSVDAGLNTRVSVPDLQAGTTYYFTVVAINTGGQESEPSDELSHLVTEPVVDPVIPRTGWVLQSADSQEAAGYAATNAFDGDPTTFWHTAFSSGTTPHPHEIQIDLGSSYPVKGFRYLPRQDPHLTGNIAQYEFYISTDGMTWGAPVVSGTFASSKDEKEVLFTPQNTRYVRLRSLSEVEGGNDCNVAELNVLRGVVAPPPPLPAKPTGLKVVEIQVSANLKDWKTIAFVPLNEQDAAAGFVRAGLTTIETP